MNKEQERTVMLSLIRSLRENGSWCGETHIQKAAYFLKTVTAVPLKFEFILYKHGPFSFDLRDHLGNLIDGLAVWARPRSPLRTVNWP